VCRKNKTHTHTHSNTHTNTHKCVVGRVEGDFSWSTVRIGFTVREDNLYAGAMSNDWFSEGSSYPSFALDVTGLSPPPPPSPRPRQLRSLRLRFVRAFFFFFVAVVVLGCNWGLTEALTGPSFMCCRC